MLEGENIFLHCGVLRKRSGFGVKGDSLAHPTDVLHLFLPHKPYMDGGLNSL